MDSWKLTIGKVAQAWRGYPAVRRSLAEIPKGKPIFISGTHRSGTTWFAKMLSSIGLWYIHEPFNPNKNYWEEPFSYRCASKRDAKVDQYFSELLQGKHRQMSHVAGAETQHWLTPVRLLSQPIQRIMIKDPLACLLTEYLHQNFDLETIVLFRHPCGFTSSIQRLGWPSAVTLTDFLSRSELMDDFLSPYQKLMEQYAGTQDSLESIAVLHGCLNAVLWKTSERNESIQTVSFEELCQSPLESFQKLFEKWELPYDDAVRSHHQSLCMNQEKSIAEYHTHSTARNSQSMAESWRDQLNADDVNRVRTIWEQFEIPFYQDDSQW